MICSRKYRDFILYSDEWGDVLATRSDGVIICRERFGSGLWYTTYPGNASDIPEDSDNGFVEACDYVQATEPMRDRVVFAESDIKLIESSIDSEEALDIAWEILHCCEL